MNYRTLATKIISEIGRLKGLNMAELIDSNHTLAVMGAVQELIYKELSDSDQIALFAGDKDAMIQYRKMPAILEKNRRAAEQAIKILTLMEASRSWQEFEQLNKARKERIEQRPKQSPNDFDKLLKGFMAVPKPKNEDLKKDKKT